MYLRYTYAYPVTRFPTPVLFDTMPCVFGEADKRCVKPNLACNRTRDANRRIPKVRRISTCILSVMIALLMAIMLVEPVSAEQPRPADYDIANGHFYTETVPTPDQASGYPRGYAITNEEGIAFWSEYKRLGGAGVLGYPVSRRFMWNGTVVQVMQKAVLQWEPKSGRANLVEVMDEMGKVPAIDAWLAAKGVPHVQSDSKSADVDALQQISIDRLNGNPAIKKAYLASPDPMFYYGLPTSDVVPMQDGYILRTQRTVLMVWNIDQKWAKAGTVVSGLVGEMVRDSGMFPASVFTAMDAPATLPPPPARPAPAPIANAGVTSSAPAQGANVVATRTGRASWYGSDFQGSPMANGEPYDMYNPTTTACNIYPLGSWLRVTSNRTGRSVIVRVTDTGAFREPFLVDLSYAAFRSIDDPSAGWVNATVELLSGPPR